MFAVPLCMLILSVMLQVDFGCILNDTETICYVTMTNSSPLEVRYAWSFLRRPPVQRVDPEQHDEGVDMQSECESDSLEDEEEEEEEGSGEDSGEEDGEERVEEGLDGREDAESKTVTSASGSPLPSTTAPQDEQQTPGASPKYATSIPVTPVVETAALGELLVAAPPEQLGTPVEDGAPSVEAEVQEVLESGLPAGDSIASREESVSGCGQEGGSDSQKGSVERGSGRGARRSKKKKAPPQPWELVTDPFTPISIEQVNTE